MSCLELIHLSAVQAPGLTAHPPEELSCDRAAVVRAVYVVKHRRAFYPDDADTPAPVLQVLILHPSIYITVDRHLQSSCQGSLIGIPAAAGKLSLHAYYHEIPHQYCFGIRPQQLLLRILVEFGHADDDCSADCVEHSDYRPGDFVHLIGSSSRIA